jgi:hypothetical protein
MLYRHGALYTRPPFGTRELASMEPSTWQRALASFPFRCSRVTRPFLALLFALTVFSIANDARAYTWMVRHGYTGCVPCHQDPTGGGILTAYGRSVGSLVLNTRWDSQTEEADPLGDFLFGAVKLPQEMMLGGDARMLWLAQKLENTEVRHYLFLMQADAEAAVHIGHVLASASIGYAEDGAYPATITNAPQKNLVSRIYWAGYEFDESTGLLVRAGRMNLPFGIRSVEHTLWTRTTTATTIDDDQQVGAAVAWAPDKFRGELMAILGNYQIGPDVYRERGYSAYLEYWPLPTLGLGASSLVTHRDLDPVYLSETWRQSHGLFGRWASPWQPLVVLAEADYVMRSPKDDERRKGTVGYLQADVEMLQGVHFALTGEMQHYGVHGTPYSWGVWFSQMWFIAPHLDFRLDDIYQSIGDTSGRTNALEFLAQAHIYL